MSGEVLIAVLTYRRNADLEVLLPLLCAEAVTTTPAADILVVDNDPDAGAKDVVGRYAATYEHELIPGIAAARNRALTIAAGRGFLVFIDDDEHPRPGWLRALLGTIAGTGAAAVSGAVVSEFEHEPDEWITAGGFFQRRRLPTGTPITGAATDNLVLDLHQIRPLGLWFDERLGLIGGSDNLFTRTLVRAGKAMVWCDEAVVVDRVPDSRLTREWVRRRAYRLANSEVTVSLMMATTWHDRAAVRVKAVGNGTLRILGGAMRILYGVMTGSLAFRARGSRTMRRGFGMVAAAAGSTYAEYLRDVPPRKTWAQRSLIRK